MINTTFVESTIENIQIIKKELINDCSFDIDNENDNKIIISCGGKCGGHDNEILEICKDIKLLSQHIDIDSDNFEINYYYKNNIFSCNFGWDDQGGYGNIDDLTKEQLNILVEENIFSIVNGEYVNNKKFPFYSKTTSIYCNVCKEHHDSKFNCENQKKEVRSIKIEESDEEEIQNACKMTQIKPSRKSNI